MLTPVEIRLQNVTSSFCLRTYFKLTLLIKQSFVRSTRYGTKPETFAVMRPKRQSSVMLPRDVLSHLYGNESPVDYDWSYTPLIMLLS